MNDGDHVGRAGAASAAVQVIAQSLYVIKGASSGEIRGAEAPVEVGAPVEKHP